MLVISILSAGVVGLSVPGCASVDPHPDFERAGRLISERTGVDGAYDPHVADEIDARVNELLADGLTVEEAVRVALLNNPDFQRVAAEIGAARADLAQSALLTNPTISLAFQVPEGGGVTDFTFGLAQQLSDLWQIPARKRVAEAELEKTILTAGQRAVQLASDVRAACFRLLSRQRTIEIAEQNARLAERAVQLAEAQLRAGEVSEFDANLTRAGLLDVQEELIAARGSVRQSEVDLGEALGLSRRLGTVRLEDSLPTTAAALPEDDELMRDALNERFDARVAEAEVRRAENALELELRRFLPDVQVGLAFERPERRALPGRKLLADTARTSLANGKLTAPDIQSRGQRALEKSQIIDAKLGPSLAMTVPVFDQNQAQIAKARVRVIQARQDYERRAESIAADVQRAAAAARTAAEMLRFQQDQGLPQAEATVAGAERRYQAGEQGVLALLEAQDSLIRRRRALTNAVNDYAVAVTQLEAALGGRLTPAAATQPAAGQDLGDSAGGEE